MTWLTKSRFTAGLQCPKRLWLEVHAPDERVVDEEVALVHGREVDELARRLQPGAVISRAGGMLAALDETRSILDTNAHPVIHQATFRTESLVAVVDVLRRCDGAFDLIEMKGSTSVKDDHLTDVAFQALVMERAGVPVARMFIGHVAREFVLMRPGEYNGLLVEEDVTKQIQAMLPEVSRQAETAIALMQQPTPPSTAMGTQCEKPYRCPFYARCNRERGPVPAFPVTILPRAEKLIGQLSADGYEDLCQVPEERLKSADHRRIRAASVSGRAVLDASALTGLKRQSSPFAYLDFETINFALPQMVGARPYEQCPFQWSVHVEHADGRLTHSEYLAIEDFADLRTLASHLIAALPPSGPVFVYNQTLEKGVLQLLARHLPDLSSDLSAVIDRLVDLWPITKAAYYHPAMRGSWSLKAVLPSINPTLGYDTLTDIQEGGAAQLAFLTLRDGAVTPERRKEILTHMKTYCGRDTYGMVVLRRFLCGADAASLNGGTECHLTA